MLIKQGYSSPEYRNVYKDKGEIRDSNPPTIVRDSTDLSTIYPFTTQPLIYIPYQCTYKSQGLVSGVFITDPLEENVTLDTLKLMECDNVKVEPYKTHAVVDLQSYNSSKLPTNHKRNIKKCKEKGGLFVTISTNPVDMHGGVKVFYDTLKERHSIKETSWTNYSYEQIEQLLKVPGTVLFEVVKERWEGGREIFNLSLFYIDRENVYYHLSSQSDDGYRLNSNFIMMDEAINFFKRLGLNKLLIGGKADGSAGEGLWRFKSGFATETRENYIIKVIYDQEKYATMSKGKEGNFFPLYRS